MLIVQFLILNLLENNFSYWITNPISCHDRTLSDKLKLAIFEAVDLLYIFSSWQLKRINIKTKPNSGITNAREAMKKLPEEDRAKIAQQVEVFRIEKRAFDNEVSKHHLNT